MTQFGEMPFLLSARDLPLLTHNKIYTIPFCFYKLILIPSRLYLPSHSLLYCHPWHLFSNWSLDRCTFQKCPLQLVLRYTQIFHLVKSILSGKKDKGKDKTLVPQHIIPYLDIDIYHIGNSKLHFHILEVFLHLGSVVVYHQC